MQKNQNYQMPNNDALTKKLLNFQPEKGIIIMQPEKLENGWWVGAPSLIYDEQYKKFFMAYRIRKPWKMGRGTDLKIAESKDGINFKNIWSINQQELNSTSIERPALVKIKNFYRLYISYEINNKYWIIDAIDAKTPYEFNLKNKIKILESKDTNGINPKDPYIFFHNKKYYMFVAYNPSLLKGHYSGLAISQDGLKFKWQGTIIKPSIIFKWDSYSIRVDSILKIKNGFYIFYDGCGSKKEIREEKSGLMFTTDFKKFTKIGRLPYQNNGSLRYVEAIQKNNIIYIYYEYASHAAYHTAYYHQLQLNKISLK